MLAKIWVVFIPFLFLGNAAVPVQAPYTVAGVVKDKQTGEPVRHVHVFTVKGEEEAVSNDKGEFNFTTWQQSPSLTTEKGGYQRTTTKLALPMPMQVVLIVKE